MAHPIRPESYIAMDNFYTATVYDKGAEIIRLYHTQLGTDGFRRGMDLYFERHDGGAVTCDDFRQAMADANVANLDALDRWYSQPGTPVLDVAGHWSPGEGHYTLSCKQSYPALSDDIPGAVTRQPVPIPIAVGLLNRQGQQLPLQLLGEPSSPDASTRTLMLTEEEGRFTFTGLEEAPIVSVLRNFSAPVKLRIDSSPEELAFRMAHDTDPFNRWDAGQSLATVVMLELADLATDGETLRCPPTFIDTFGQVLADGSLDGAFKALALTLPSEIVLGQGFKILDPDAVHQAREFLRVTLAQAHRDGLLATYEALAGESAYRADQRSINDRRLKNTVLAYLASLNQSETTALVARQFERADNMTDAQAALTLLVDLDCPERDLAVASFYERWRSDPLVLDKWFSVQANSNRSDTLERVRELTSHPDFTLSNPNRVRALLSAFALNQVRFHQRDGAGYQLLADYVLRIDSDNRQLAARLVSQFNSYRRFEEGRQTLIRQQLTRIAAHEGSSKDVYEIVERALKF